MGAAYAQQPAESHPTADKVSLQPLLLTKDQVERLAVAEQTRELARARLQAAQNLLDKIEAQIDGLIKEFQRYTLMGEDVMDSGSQKTPFTIYASVYSPRICFD